MLFNSLEFLIFFPAVAMLFYLLPHRYRNYLLLSSSCIFYMAFIPSYILILLFTVIVDFFAAIKIEELPEEKKILPFLTGIISTILVLFIFKYYNFFTENLTILLNLFKIRPNFTVLNLILPIGLSFHTFQSLSYLIEVYWKKQAAERDFCTFFLYVLFFPQLMAGPIEKPQNLLPQFREKKEFIASRVFDGMKYFCWGLFKKVVIADRIAQVVDQIYQSPGESAPIAVFLAVFFFSFQVYCDFSGYSDMAVGIACVFGFRLMNNFNRPYFAVSTTEIWRRWHISLSDWLREYMYSPLALHFREWQKAGICLSLVITFLICGLWHGARWTFVIYGLLQGTMLVIEFLTQKIRKKISKKMPEKISALSGWTVTFLFWCFSLIFFRSCDASQAWTVISQIINFGKGIMIKNNNLSWNPEIGKYQVSLIFVMIVVLVIIEIFQKNNTFVYLINRWSIMRRWTFLLFLILSIAIFGVMDEQQFIYFQF